jgi:small subunit ribosomal protein S1
MLDLVNEVGPALIPIKERSMVDATVVTKSKNKILVNIKGLNLGFIPEKEFSSDVYELKPGDKVLAYVLSSENDDGFAVLSLKRADKERFMSNLSDKFKNQDIVTVRVKQANRGGLIVEYGSLEGFLPASQLSSTHYPKVGDDKDRIMGKLNELVSQNLKVKILSYDQQNNKLIFSEKAAGDVVLEEKINTLKVNDEYDGNISGIVDFGVFVDIGGLEGLVHISEISWDKVENLKKIFKIGDKVKVKVLNLEGNRVYFSIKRLTQDPWLEQVKNYSVGQVVKGKISKITPFGIFVELSDQVKGLIHISELVEKIKQTPSGKIEELFNLGSEYEFTISSLEPDSRKINLSLGKNDNNAKDSEEKNEPKVKKSTKK